MSTTVLRKTNGNENDDEINGGQEAGPQTGEDRRR
jgi:hypothetical protein